MSSLIISLQNITVEEINGIAREYEGMPNPDYSQACVKARGAATVLRKATWNIFSMAHINALLMGLNKIKFSDSYTTMKLIAATECYSFAVMGQLGLGYEDFNLAIGPIATVFAPELFTDEQDWTQEPVPKAEYVRPTYRVKRTRGPKPLEPNRDDLIGLVDSLVKEAAQGISQNTPHSTFHADQTASSSALDAMLKGMKK